MIWIWLSNVTSIQRIQHQKRKWHCNVIDHQIRLVIINVSRKPCLILISASA